MLYVVVLVVSTAVGFVASRRLRRPDRAAQAASAARAVSGSLGRRRGLTPPELQRACFSEMVRHVRVNRQARTHAPARYLIRLHPDDLAIVDESRRWFTEGLADALRQAAADNGWLLDGTVDIAYEADPARHPGVPSALAVPPEAGRGAAPSAPPPAPRRAAPAAATGATGGGLALVRVDTGQRVALGTEPVTIGRGRDRTLTVDDKRVSRTHARVEPRPGGWAVIDEGSANGTRLNGADLSPHVAQMLRAGDVVGVGPFDLKVVPGPAVAEPGTRALDDSDRNRISREVLPPRRSEGRS